MILKVRANPNSDRLSFELKGDVLHARLTEPAENNKANLQLVKELAKMLGNCRLIAGAASRNKTVEVPDNAIEILHKG